MRLVYLILILCPLPFASARPIWQFTFAIVIALACLIFVARNWRRSLARLPRLFCLPVGAIGLLILTGIGQTLAGTTVAPEATVRMTLHLLAYLLFFYFVFVSFKSKDDVPKFFRNMGLIVAAYCVYGLLEYFTGNDKILWFDRWHSLSSLSSSFVNRNSFAAYAGMGLIFLITYSSWLIQSSKLHIGSFKSGLIAIYKNNFGIFSFLMIVTFVTATALLLTASRAGIASALLAITFFLVTQWRRKNNVGGIGSLTNVVGLIAVALMIAATLGLSGDRLIDRLNSDSMGERRAKIYLNTVEAIQDEAVYGTGIGSFSEVYAFYRKVKDGGHRTETHRAHNDYLEILLTAGPVFGGTAIVLLLVFMTRLFFASKASSRYSIFVAGSAAILFQLALHSLLDFSLQIPAIAISLIAIMAASARIFTREPG